MLTNHPRQERAQSGISGWTEETGKMAGGEAKEAWTAMAESTGQDGATRTLSDSDFAVGTADRYFEDYTADAVYEYGYASVSEAEIIAFATRFDPQPIHVDA